MIIFHNIIDLGYNFYNSFTYSVLFAIETTVPCLPDLEALPALWIAYSAFIGISKLITKLILRISIPLAIISLVTKILFFPY